MITIDKKDNQILRLKLGNTINAILASLQVSGNKGKYQAKPFLIATL